MPRIRELHAADRRGALSPIEGTDRMILTAPNHSPTIYWSCECGRSGVIEYDPSWTGFERFSVILREHEAQGGGCIEPVFTGSWLDDYTAPNQPTAGPAAAATTQTLTCLCCHQAFEISVEHDFKFCAYQYRMDLTWRIEKGELIYAD